MKYSNDFARFSGLWILLSGNRIICYYCSHTHDQVHIVWEAKFERKVVQNTGLLSYAIYNPWL